MSGFPGQVWLSVGFRPFFLAAGACALLPVLSWVLLMAGMPANPGYYGPELYHAHEMVFGYLAAVMAGFLLTAIRNWTGVQTAQGHALAALVVIWLAGRLASLGGGFLPPVLIALLDVAFLPALALAAARPLVKTGNNRNLIFPAMLLAMAAANVLVHLSLLGALPALLAEQVLTAAALVAVLMVTVMAGRVFPMFSKRGAPASEPHVRQTAWIEKVAAPMVLPFVLLLLWDPQSVLVPLWALALAVVHGLRFAGLHSVHVWRVPLVWILHAGYAWLVIGFFLYPLAWAGYLPHHAPVHALTAGALGSITLGMMSRVALGHTGRPLVAPSPMAWSFGVLQLAAALRVFGTLLPAEAWPTVVVVSGLLWTLAFVLFLVTYFPVLVRPREDGAPG